MSEEDSITAAIIGELIPELAYAAPLLLKRLDSGEPLIQRTSPTDVGFEGGNVDPVLLEFFKALVPFVRATLQCGVLVILQNWLLHRSNSRAQAELTATLKAHFDRNAKAQEAGLAVAGLLTALDKNLVSVNDVFNSLAAAAQRVSKTDDAPPE